MKIGLLIDERGLTLQQITAAAATAAEAGLAGFWMGQHYDWDPLTALVAAAQAAPGIELASAIIPTYPVHPVVLASQALSAQAVSGNRITLGLGVSHQVIIEGTFGIPYERPAKHLRDYLTALIPLLRGETVAFQGETLTANGSVRVPGAEPPALLLSALGPLMLKLAGEMTDGTITNWAGAATLENFVAPTINKAAADAGRPAPRVIAGVMVSVTADEAGVRAGIAETFGLAASLPAYRGMLDREGAAGVEDVAIVGDESSVERQLRRQLDAGATEFIAVPMGNAQDRARTLAVLSAITRQSG